MYLCVCVCVCVCVYIYIYIYIYMVWLALFCNSALDVGEWLASRPGHFTPQEEACYPAK